MSDAFFYTYGLVLKIQIQFQHADPSLTDNPVIDAVYCTDLYADQIEAERNGTSSTQDYTKAFQDYYGTRMVCPNATNITINANYTLSAKLLQCGKA